MLIIAIQIVVILFLKFIKDFSENNNWSMLQMKCAIFSESDDDIVMMEEDEVEMSLKRKADSDNEISSPKRAKKSHIVDSIDGDDDVVVL